MRKTLPKLALCKETLRALADSDLVRLVKVRGGGARLLGDLTQENVCPLVKALKR